MDDAWLLLCLDKERDGLDRVHVRFLEFMMSELTTFEQRQEYYDAYQIIRSSLSCSDTTTTTTTSTTTMTTYIYPIYILLLYRPKDVLVTLPIQLEDVYSAATKKISVVTLKNGVKTTRDVYICLSEPSMTYTFVGQGDTVGNQSSDIIIDTVLEPHPAYRIDCIVCDYDLHTNVNVSMIDYLYGMTYTLHHLDGSLIRVEYPRQSGKRVQVIHGRGLLLHDDSPERGLLYVFFDIEMPCVKNDRLENPVTKMFLAKVFSKSV